MAASKVRMKLKATESRRKTRRQGNRTAIQHVLHTDLDVWGKSLAGDLDAVGNR